MKITKIVALEIWILTFPTNLCRKLQVFKKSPKWTFFGIFYQLLFTQNVNVARFARNVECDLFLWFSKTVQKSSKINVFRLVKKELFFVSFLTVFCFIFMKDVLTFQQQVPLFSGSFFQLEPLSCFWLRGSFAVAATKASPPISPELSHYATATLNWHSITLTLLFFACSRISAQRDEEHTPLM